MKESCTFNLSEETFEVKRPITPSKILQYNCLNDTCDYSYGISIKNAGVLRKRRARNNHYHNVNITNRLHFVYFFQLAKKKWSKPIKTCDMSYIHIAIPNCKTI